MEANVKKGMQIRIIIWELAQPIYELYPDSNLSGGIIVISVKTQQYKYMRKKKMVKCFEGKVHLY